MPQSLYLAIDQGGQSTRIAIYTATGELRYCHSAPCATTHHLHEGVEFIEQSGEEILAGIRTGLHNIQQELGDSITAIAAAGFAGQGSSLLCWNSTTGEALTPVISWQDIRGQAYLNNFPYSHQQIQQKTGLRVSPHYGASKIRWCLENNAAVKMAQQEKCLSVGPIVSYLLWHLLDEKQHQIDPGHAQRTLLWNITTNNWDEDLLFAFKMPKDILPQCRYHNSHLGMLSVAQHKIPFCVSARDQGASLFANGKPNTNNCYINIGTGAFIQRVSNNLQAPNGLLVSPLWLPQPQQSAAPLHNIHHPIEVASPVCYAPELLSPLQTESLYAWEATVNGAASAISFMEQQTGLAITPQIIEAALKLSPAHECYFLNAVGGLSAPYWRTDLSSRFSHNLTSTEKILAWLESVVFQMVVNVKLMEEKEPLTKTIISGGLSNADALCQKIADLTGATVSRSENADASLRGIAYLTAGLHSNWGAIHQNAVFEPQKNLPLQARFNNWQQAMQQWLNNC